MSYFTAVIAADASGWRARDVDVTDAGSLDDLAEVMRLASVGDRPVLAVLEREDEWFALIRVDGDDDPRLFVSDMAAAGRSKFADLLAPAAEVEVSLDEAAGNGVPAGASGALGEAGGAVLGSPPVDSAALDAARDEADDEDGPALAADPDDVDPDGPDAEDPDDAGSGDDPDADDGDLLLAADEEEAPGVEPPGLATWAGDPRLLEDLGLDPRRLADLVEDTPDPAEVIGEVGEACGFSDLLEALR